MTKPLTMVDNFTQHGVLLVNLGSPRELSVSAIRSFLAKFLADKRVVGLPRLLWYPILYGIILPFRAPKLLAKYTKIWHPSNQAPLTFYTARQAQLLKQACAAANHPLQVEYAFAYTRPSIAEALARLIKNGCQQLTIIPLYPQYSSSTTAAVYDQVSAYFYQQYFIPGLDFIQSFATHPLYIDALAAQVLAHWQRYGRAPQLVVSFHSLPQKLVTKGDSYVSECELTFNLLCHKLNLDPKREASLCYQSKFGRSKWVEPSTAQTISKLAATGVTVIDVICPGFISDCLETLDEVALEYQDLFIQHGGQELRYIPSLNQDERLIKLLKSFIV